MDGREDDGACGAYFFLVLLLVVKTVSEPDPNAICTIRVTNRLINDSQSFTVYLQLTKYEIMTPTAIYKLC